VRAVRNQLASDLAGTTIDRAARRIGVSARVLQRRLRDAGTTFRDEHKRAQLAQADALLRDTDLEIGTIALECGYASIQHFSTAVRRLTGKSPSQRRHDLRAR
jgi:AraC-like DNA-binding protein